MDNKKEDAYFARQIISNIDTIREYVKDMTYDDYISSQMVVDSTLFRLVQIGEEIKKLSPKFKFDNSEIAWGLILGLETELYTITTIPIIRMFTRLSPKISMTYMPCALIILTVYEGKDF